jgi:hypothetical protein
MPQTAGNLLRATRPDWTIVEAQTGESHAASSKEDAIIAAHRKSCEVIAEADIRSIVGIPGGGTMRICDALL